MTFFSSPLQLAFPKATLWTLSLSITTSPPKSLIPVPHSTTTSTFLSSFIVEFHYSYHEFYFTSLRHLNQLPFYFLPIDKNSLFFTSLFNQPSFIINHFNNIFVTTPNTLCYLSFYCINLKKNANLDQFNCPTSPVVPISSWILQKLWFDRTN